MNMPASNSEWLDEHDACTAEYLIRVSGLSGTEFDELVEIGVIAPIESINGLRRYRQGYVITAMVARRLRDDFELDLHGVALAMTLMQRIDLLKRELAAARARLPD
jgi:chaperone modulatory protein CbpM